jgi:hypothetical protein
MAEREEDRTEGRAGRRKARPQSGKETEDEGPNRMRDQNKGSHATLTCTSQSPPVRADCHTCHGVGVA